MEIKVTHYLILALAAWLGAKAGRMLDREFKPREFAEESK